MSSIKKQNIRYDGNGRIVSGTAAIMDTVYDPSVSGHSRKISRETLGKVLWLAKDSRSGIFLSPRKGLVHYDSVKDLFSEVDITDERIADQPLLKNDVSTHTIFGDSYMLLMFMEKIGIIDVLRSCLKSDSDYERLLCHITHTILKNGSRKGCDDFIEQSFMSYLVSDISFSSLGSDSAYFTMMGKDSTKVRFFRNFVSLMRKKDADFGKACYVDSTPLPNEIRKLFSDALCSHGISSSSNQIRLVLILDEKTSLPVWYTLIPGNILDISTLRSVYEDVLETLDIKIDSYVLDGGYLSKELIETINIDTPDYEDEDGIIHHKRLSAKMPAKKGFPYRELFDSFRAKMFDPSKQFDRNGHTYFGEVCESRIFGTREYTYVYLDIDNALYGIRDYRAEHYEEYEALPDKQKEWYTYKWGYFVIVSNEFMKPDTMLERYFSRTRIETFFKTAKDFLDLLPLSKWHSQTVEGKILNDLICSIIYVKLREKINAKNKSTSKLIARTQSLMCFRKSNGTVFIEKENKQVRQLYKDLEIAIPDYLNIGKFRKESLMINKDSGNR